MNANRYELYRKNAFYAVLDIEENEKNKSRFIKVIEMLIRGSHEYRQFIAYLKKEADLTYCSILRGLDEDTFSQVSLEMHHYPFTLYDITETILNKKIRLNEDFTRLSIANDVLNLHFSLEVGIIPLTKSMHEMAHSGNILLSLEKVFGDYKRFKEEYWIYMSDPVRERYNAICSKVENQDFVDEYNRLVLSLNPNLFLDNTAKVKNEFLQD